MSAVLLRVPHLAFCTESSHRACDPRSRLVLRWNSAALSCHQGRSAGPRSRPFCEVFQFAARWPHGFSNSQSFAARVSAKPGCSPRRPVRKMRRWLSASRTRLGHVRSVGDSICALSPSCALWHSYRSDLVLRSPMVCVVREHPARLVRLRISPCDSRELLRLFCGNPGLRNSLVTFAWLRRPEPRRHRRHPSVRVRRAWLRIAHSHCPAPNNPPSMRSKVVSAAANTPPIVRRLPASVWDADDRSHCAVTIRRHAALEIHEALALHFAAGDPAFQHHRRCHLCQTRKGPRLLTIFAQRANRPCQAGSILDAAHRSSTSAARVHGHQVFAQRGRRLDPGVCRSSFGSMPLSSRSRRGASLGVLRGHCGHRVRLRTSSSARLRATRTRASGCDLHMRDSFARFQRLSLLYRVSAIASFQDSSPFSYRLHYFNSSSQLPQCFASPFAA